jgi:CDP-diacylglycerol--glycerol-3-phosphate 3-phosphatidyltransferase
MLRQTPTDWMRQHTRGLLTPIAALLARLGITPNMVTVLGLFVNLFAAALLAQGQFAAAGWFLLVFGPLDAVDGALARLTGKKSRFGAFLDSTLDRYSEILLYFGLLVHFFYHPEPVAPILVFAAVVGSLLVSYVKARAEALGYECNVGLLTRMERFIVLSVGLILGLVIPTLWIIAILANLTALYRMLHVWRKTVVSGQ